MSKVVLERYLDTIDQVIEKGVYKADWTSLAKHKVPDWYRDGKFGIFIHWGVYSVPEYSDEWYPRRMYLEGHLRRDCDCFNYHREKYGEHKDFGYKDFVPMFTCEQFDPKEWAKLFKQAGARFVMPVAEHHDGFQMYASDLSEWNAVEMGPKRDLLGELREAIVDENMIFTASSHRVEHYWFLDGARTFESDFPEEIPYGHIYWPSVSKEESERDGEVIVDQLFMEDWLARTCELVDKYQPQIVFFDWWIQVKPMKPYLKKFMAYYYNRALEWNKEVTINYKHDAYIHTSAVKDIERGQLSNVSPYFWQNDTSVAKHSWSYTENNDYKNPRDIICDLIDVVSKNGALLLNVDPKASGEIPAETKHTLQEIGNWLSVNGEAIYDTYVYRIFGEGPTEVKEGSFTDTKRGAFTSEDFRFTFKDNNLYIFCLKWPEDGVVRIKSFGKKERKFEGFIEEASILGYDNSCKAILCDEYLTIIGGEIDTDYPVCIKLQVD